MSIRKRKNYLKDDIAEAEKPIYFESKDDFEKCFNIKYDDSLNEVFHSIRIKKIKFQGEETYSGTFIYHETFGEKMKFQLAYIKYLSRFQKEEMWR